MPRALWGIGGRVALPRDRRGTSLEHRIGVWRIGGVAWRLHGHGRGALPRDRRGTSKKRGEESHRGSSLSRADHFFSARLFLGANTSDPSRSLRFKMVKLIGQVDVAGWHHGVLLTAHVSTIGKKHARLDNCYYHRQHPILWMRFLARN